MRYDTVVVGAGVAGLTAAVRLAETGQRVVVLAKGVGSTHLTGGTIDILGYAPDRVKSPARSLPSFVGSHPEHPYARLSAKAIPESIEWLRAHVSGYGYEGRWDRNFLLPTAVGVPKPTAVVPDSMKAGDLRSGGRFVIVGFRAMKDFHPAYCADNLTRTKTDSGDRVDARGVSIDPLVGGEADVGPLEFARRFDDAEYRKAFVGQLHDQIEPDESVGLPAVLGMREPHTVWEEIQDGLGAPVFEIPTLPPSVPGIRLFDALRGALRRAGGRLVSGGGVIGADVEGDRVKAVVQQASARPVSYGGRWFVLATGGFASGGLAMDSRGVVREAVFDLPPWGVPAPGELRFSPVYSGPHPMSKAGVAVDGRLRPLNENGDPVFRNLFAAGATIAGAVPWQEKSGEGISLSTGFTAASSVLQEA